MIWIVVAAGAQGMAPISVPYQAQPAFIAYTSCVGEHLKNDGHGESGNVSTLQHANSDALAACRDIRARELARGVAAVGDTGTPVAPPFRTRREAQAAVGRAFDRFDADYEIK